MLWFITKIGNELLDQPDFALDAFPTFSYLSHLVLNFVFCKVDARCNYCVVAYYSVGNYSNFRRIKRIGIDCVGNKFIDRFKVNLSLLLDWE